MISILRHAEHRHRLLRGRAGWLLVAAGAAVAVVSLVALSKTSLLHARSIEVSGSSSLNRAQVLELSGLDRDTNVLWFDDAAAERRLESNAWVADAEVTMSLPATIRISLIERVPVALASDGHGDVLIARDGIALGSPKRPADLRGLPRIQLAVAGAIEGSPQSPAGAALALGAMGSDLRSRVTRVSVLLDGTLEVWLRSGPLVRFGAASEFVPKARAIAQALAWAEAEGERILYLSVTSPSAPAATLAP